MKANGVCRLGIFLNEVRVCVTKTFNYEVNGKTGQKNLKAQWKILHGKKSENHEDCLTTKLRKNA